MYGAILGDIIGSPYEFDMGDKKNDFPLFSKRSMFTDDNLMTIAVAEAFLDIITDHKAHFQQIQECPGILAARHTSCLHDIFPLCASAMSQDFYGIPADKKMPPETAGRLIKDIK